MTIDVIKFFTPDRFFNFKPAPLSSDFLVALLIIFGSLIIGAVIVKILQKKNKFDQLIDKLLNRYFVFLLTMGTLGLLYTWFRAERVMMLSARFWLVVWFIGLVTWFVPIIKYQKKSIPEIRDNRINRKNFEKYLPRSKKR